MFYKFLFQGYVEKARKRPEMFSEEQIQTIFSNIESIYTFSRAFCQELEKQYIKDAPNLSQFGEVFLQYVSRAYGLEMSGFKI